MGHISHEPSMEEILSSIKRIIAEDEGPVQRGRKPQAKPVKLGIDMDQDDQPTAEAEVLELTEAVAPAREEIVELEAARPAPPPVAPEDIVSTTAANASRNALASLSRLKVRPDEGIAENSLEGLVRDMLRPMLKEWLDTNLPAVVETMVAKEIARISGSQL